VEEEKESKQKEKTAVLSVWGNVLTTRPLSGKEKTSAVRAFLERTGDVLTFLPEGGYHRYQTEKKQEKGNKSVPGRDDEKKKRVSAPCSTALEKGRGDTTPSFSAPRGRKRGEGMGCSHQRPTYRNLPTKRGKRKLDARKKRKNLVARQGEKKKKETLLENRKP